MLVENTEAKSRVIGDIHVIPSFNKIDDKIWDAHVKGKWGKPIKGLISSGIIKVDDARTKVTIEMVKNTYSVDLLNEWLVKAKGPLKGAITKQIAMMEDAPVEDENLGNL